MPRISIYKPEKGDTYRFVDRQISKYFQMSAPDIFLHKYLGPKSGTEGTADQPVYENTEVTNIQDLLFLENRDRKYDPDVYKIRGLYNVQNIDFNLSQFGLFLDNDTINMTVHINDFIDYVGRKPISGDVIEIPNLKDDFALNDFDVSVPRYYVVEDVSRASEGYSTSWFPHIFKMKLKKVTDSQQFSDILDMPASETSDATLRDLLSTRNTELQINDAIIAQAEADAPLSGYETRQFYKLERTADGHTILQTVDNEDLDASHYSQILDYDGTNLGANISASSYNNVPRKGFSGYLLGDGFPINGNVFGHGIQFPENPAIDDFFLRTDFIPNRLYRFAGKRWSKVEDAVRMTMTNNDSRETFKTKFINNDKYVYSDVVKATYHNAEKLDYVLDTDIPYTTVKYVVLKLRPPKSKFVLMDFAVDEYPTLTSNYNGNLRITLPIENNVQVTLPMSGTWRIELCNDRQAQRQSLSQVLKIKPQADL